MSHYNRYSQNRDNYSTPPRNRGGYNQRRDDRPHSYNQSNRYDNSCNYQQPRSFNDRGQQVFGYHERDRNYDEPIAPPKLSPLEIKARTFLNTVFAQRGVKSKLIFLESIENDTATLQSTVDSLNMSMIIQPNAEGIFTLNIENETIVQGNFASKQLARNKLSKQAVDMLRKDCFYIIKKKEFEEVSTKVEQKKEEPQSSNLEGSKAHQMMLKMGWSGKGLGVNEQGEQKTVAETIDQNISREGLGADNVFKKIHQILEDYSKSDSMSLLKFDPDFSSEERAHIHKIAQKLGLKSKSEGKGEQRRMTVTKKLHRADLVYNLLISGLENALYKLIIPVNFKHLWSDSLDQVEDDDEDDCQPSFCS